MNLPIHEYYFHRHANLMLGAGLFSCLTGLVSVALTGRLGTVVFGAVFIVLGVAARKSPVIAVGASHIEVRLATLRPKRLVRAVDIVTADDQGKNILLLTTQGHVLVPLQLIAEKERQLVRQSLRRLRARHSPPSTDSGKAT